MTTLIQIRDIARCEGQEVTLRGWVYNRTDKGKLQFIQMRDGSGIAQCVAFKREMAEDEFEIAGRLTQESSIIITGVVRRDERAPGVPAATRSASNGWNWCRWPKNIPSRPKNTASSS